ncbi:MAG: hypothetical protein GC151_00320 [Betaproteobacteria bacterium]|nr:hypothetical protein [Betaproteobacteria bacterium]
MLLLLVLVCAQQVGIMHAFGHARPHGATHEHTKGVPTTACDLCIAYAQIHPAPCPTPITAPAAASPVVPSGDVEFESARPLALVPFRSRAPPRLP